MDYQIDWSKEPKGWNSHVEVGIYKPHPSITFTVIKRTLRWNQAAGKDIQSITYDVDCDIQGNSSAVVLNTPDEVIAYLEHQTSLLPDYFALIGKRDKLSERIRPLQNKYFKYGDQLHGLAKSR